MVFIEVFATVFGLLQALLVLYNKRSNWVFYILQMLCLIAFNLKLKLYGDLLNCFIYLIMGIVGFVLWNNSKKELPITKCSIKERLIYVLTITLSTLIIYLFLKKTQDPKPLIDAFTTSSSFVATYYMLRRSIDTWVIWFVNDISYSIQYVILNTPAYYLMALNIIWTFMAVASYIKWNNILTGDNNEKNLLCR